MQSPSVSRDRVVTSRVISRITIVMTHPMNLHVTTFQATRVLLLTLANLE